MPFISVIVPTMRVGGIDILLDSLAKQTFTDFELVLVDAICERRKDRLLEEARDRFLAVKHVGPNPSPFPVCSFCAMSNCGIAVSSGEVLLFAVDYTRFPADLLERHARFHKADPSGRAGMMGPHRYVHFKPDPLFPGYHQGDIDRYESDVHSGALDRFMLSCGTADDLVKPLPHNADGGAVVPFDADPKLRMPAGQIGPEFFHAKNESVRRQRVLEVDGYDQDLDGAHLYQDSDFSDRLHLKAGVRWMLDPHAVTEIVNPRHVFPFARRTRPHEENKKIWESKKASGYPNRPNSVLVGLKMKERIVEGDPSVGMVTASPMKPTRPVVRKLRVGMIYGEFSSAIHGPFDIDGLYTRAGLTGSESSFFNLARTLAERGHEVIVFCDTPREADHSSGFNAMPIFTLGAFPRVQGVDAVLAWNEPDYLQFAPQGALRVCDQQLNDFGYAGSAWYAQAGKWLGPHATPRWREMVDAWVSPSANHRQNVMSEMVSNGAQVRVIPNSVDLGLFDGEAPVRNRTRAVWCSSPDRGLHHLLSFWPDVRKRVPQAELHVFYRLAPWLAAARGNEDEVGRRARYIEHALERLGQRHGVYVHDNVPNERMARELQAAACLAYPCDPVRYTEGFGCSVLDAAAGGCIPIISAADALPEVHGQAVIGIPGPPQDQRKAWVESIIACMEGRVDPIAGSRMRAHAEAHDRNRIADAWEALINRRV